MSDNHDPSSEQTTLPWMIALIAGGGICAMLVFVTTRSAKLAALIGSALIVSLLIGWWAAIWARATRSGVRPLAQSNSPSGMPLAETIESGVASTRFARAAIEATPNPVIIIDQGGQIVATNQASRTRFSLGEEQVRFNNAIRRPDLIDAVEGVLKDRQPRNYPIETRVPVDRFERVSIAAFEFRGAIFVLVSVQDETEIRMSERMRADFLANASHELRTPLAAIIGFIETLRGPARDDEVARTKFLEVMHLQAGRMSRLISDLLSLSRIELNEHVQPTGSCNLTSAVFEAVDGLTPDKKQRIRIVGDPQPIWLLGDRDEMAQVISNLIDNALKYGGARESVSLYLSSDLIRDDAVTTAMRQWEDASRLPLTSPPVERDRLYAVLRVEDLGPGIARQHLPRLSERFFRIEDTASGKGGTGLGLAIVKHIVSRHRGGLVVESELGRGSAFSVYLPQTSARFGTADGTSDG